MFTAAAPVLLFIVTSPISVPVTILAFIAARVVCVAKSFAAIVSLAWQTARRSPRPHLQSRKALAIKRDQIFMQRQVISGEQDWAHFSIEVHCLAFRFDQQRIRCLPTLDIH